MTLVSDYLKTTNPTTAENDLVPSERVWDILKSIDIGMLVTTSESGLRGRPMSTIPTPGKGVIYILTESTSSAALDIGRVGDILLSYQGSGDHVALQGKATVDPDADLVAQLWNPGAQIFWPDGPQTHNVVTLVIDPGRADVWDGHGILRGFANIVRSAISGTSPDLGTRGVVDL